MCSSGFSAGAGAGAAPAASSRPASISRALCASTRAPYFANSGDAFAGPSTSAIGAIFEAGASIRVCTTGVGTPFSLSSVTAASPVPIEVSSSPTS